MLIAIRVVVITTLVLAALIIQFTAPFVLPLGYLYLTAGLTYGMTLLYIGMSRFFSSRKVQLSLQIGGDVLIETLLIYFTGGLDSPFSFLYLVSIITASMLLYRRGGLVTASGCVILYGALADLIFYQFLPLPSGSNLFPTPTQWTSLRLYLNMATNFAGFYATALLTSLISEKLRKTADELTANQQNLERLEVLNQNIIESIPSGLITMSQDGAISFANPAAGEILGVTAESLTGRHVSDAIFFTSDEWSALKLRATLLNDEVFRAEKKDVIRNGEERTFGYAVTSLRGRDGNSYGLTLIFQDLTEIKKLEGQLRLRDRMAAVGELSAGIAHEIRNPLAAISGSAQVLRNSERLTPQEARLMSIILKESERLNKSIAEFLRFVKPQEKRSSPFDIAASLTETLDLLANSSELRPDHEIARRIEPSSFVIEGDSDQIRQVLWNIARNAFQAMPGGGTLTVATTLSQGFYRIELTDEGRGMSEAEQRIVFQPFRTRFPSGTGLGMAISYRIVHEHGGRISIESKEGVGTTMTLSLPLVDTAPDSRQAAFVEAANAS
ncbi:MAG TPA: ATP-binding protein [Thermoanaerobaculia bacterium]|nr:ATP-binding protein [Thermoanaerobaculia bacterium]